MFIPGDIHVEVDWTRDGVFGTETAGNLLSNGSFEVDATGWSGDQGAATRDTTNARYGIACGRTTSTGAGGTLLARQSVVLTAVPHAFSADIWVPTAWTGGTIRLRANSLTGATGTIQALADMTKRDQWQRLSCVFTPNAGDVSCDADIDCLSLGAAGQYIRYDGIRMEVGSAASAFADATEDVTSLMLRGQYVTGRDGASYLTNKASPGQLRLTLDNSDGRFAPFNTSSPLTGLLSPGALVRVRDGSKIKWNGRLSLILPDAAASSGRQKTATLEAQGILSELSNHRITPLASAEGDYTGNLIVDALEATGVAFDTSGIEQGDVRTGPFGSTATEASLLDEMRRLEETEFGFLHEDPAIYRVNFHKRTHRAANLTPVAVFADEPSWPPSTNLIANGGFETNTTGWVTGGTNSIARSTDQAHHGTASLKCTYSNNGQLANYNLAITAAVHTFSFSLYIPSAWDGGLLSIVARGLTGSPDDGKSSPAVMSLRDQWQRIEVSFTPDAGDLVGNFRLETASPATVGRFVYIDAAQIEQQPSATGYIETDGATASRTETFLHFDQLEEADWLRSIFNRATAAKSPWTLGDEEVLFSSAGPHQVSPGGTVTIRGAASKPVTDWTSVRWDVASGLEANPSVLNAGAGTTTTDSTFGSSATLSLPSYSAGDLVMIAVLGREDTASSSFSFNTPAGWKRLRSTGATSSNGSLELDVFARKMDGTEGATLAITATKTVKIISIAVALTGWDDYAGDGTLTSNTNYLTMGNSAFTEDVLDFEGNVLQTPWTVKTLYFCIIGGSEASNNHALPEGYGTPTYVESSGTGVDSSLQLGWKLGDGNTEEEFEYDYSGDQDIATINLVAIAGALIRSEGTGTLDSENPPSITIPYDDVVGGNPQVIENVEFLGVPLNEGDLQTAQADYTPTQDPLTGVGIRTYPNPAQLFRTLEDADSYAELVVHYYGEAQPELTGHFIANASEEFYEAFRDLEVNDRITVTATEEGPSGLGFGVDMDFIIEAIAVDIAPLIGVTFTLSPAFLHDPFILDESLLDGVNTLV